jgi:hypothetical protein
MTSTPSVLKIHRMAEVYVEEMDYINDENRNAAGNGYMAGIRAGLELAAARCEREAEAFRRVPPPGDTVGGWAANICTSNANWIRAIQDQETTPSPSP